MWQTYRLTFRLLSPMHIGWRKVGNLMQTRAYITGRTMWGAASNALAQWRATNDSAADFDSAASFVRDNLLFGYFFPALDTSHPLVPRWDAGQYRFGDMPIEQFERKFLKSFASTAIESDLNAAAEGQLHETEFIVPRTDEKDTLMIGYLIAAENDHIRCEPGEVFVDQLPLFAGALAHTQAGGERRYGWGRMRLIEAHRQQSAALFGPALNTEGDRPLVTVAAGQSLPAHISAMGDPPVIGELEPLLGRQWDSKLGPGRAFSKIETCFAPGSVAQKAFRAKVCNYSIWKAVENE